VGGCAVKLVSGKGLDDIFDVVCLLLAELVAILDDDLIARHAVVEFVMDQLVLVRVDISLVLVIPVLSTHTHSYRLVDQAVLHHCPEKLLPRPRETHHAGDGWGEDVPQTAHELYMRLNIIGRCEYRISHEVLASLDFLLGLLHQHFLLLVLLLDDGTCHDGSALAFLPFGRALCLLL
jgi:hypothetical protein